MPLDEPTNYFLSCSFTITDLSDFRRNQTHVGPKINPPPNPNFEALKFFREGLNDGTPKSVN